jgi:glycosyltransferase involved in cell wall biosynthesis
MNNILSINQKYEINGGSDRYYFNLNELLRNKGHNLLEFAASGKNDSESAYSNYFPKAIEFKTSNPSSILPYLYNRQAKYALRKFLEQNIQPDVAHLQIYYGHLSSSILTELHSKGIPIIQTLHEYKFSCPVYTHISGDTICEKCLDGTSMNVIINKCKNDSYAQSTIRYLESRISRLLGDISKIDMFLCVSKFQKSLMQRVGIPEHKLKVLYNFVDLPENKNTTPHKNYFLYFGRIEKLKGIHTAIKAFQKFPNNDFKIVGVGPYTADLQKLVATLPIQNVEFLGFKSGDDLWDLVASSRAVLVPSEWYENCSMTVLESKALGRPVIASAIGGITEQIVDGENGFLHAPNEPSSISRAIERLLALTDSEYASMCQASRTDLTNRYSADLHYKKLKVVYEEIMHKNLI